MLWTPERKALARDSCRLWGGTRHHNRIAVVGQGVDCVRFVFEVLADAEVSPRFTLPRYTESLGILRARNIMERLILDHWNAGVVPAPPEFGDVAIFKCGMQSNHIGIVMDGGDVWHVPGGGHVGPEAWGNVSKRLQSLLRFTSPGWHTDPGKLTWDHIRTRAETTPDV